MQPTARLLSAFESCERRGYWSKIWELRRLNPTDILHEGIRSGLIEKDRPDFGEVAGETIMDLAGHRGLETKSHELYQLAINHACLSDLLVTSIRKPKDEAWTIPCNNGSNWRSSCLMDGTGQSLRRVLCVSNWSDDRLRSELRSWYCLGEVCHFNMPMQMIVAIVGQIRDSRRQSHWCKGLQHPKSKALRFQRRTKKTTEGFNESWQVIWREEHAEISKEKWLQSMLDDDVLRENLFVVDVPVPGKTEVEKVKEMAQKKLQKIQSLKSLPEKKLSNCEYPNPCPFRACCWSEPEKEPDFDYFNRFPISAASCVQPPNHATRTPRD